MIFGDNIAMENPRGAMVAQWPPKPKVASSSLTEDDIFFFFTLNLTNLLALFFSMNFLYFCLTKQLNSIREKGLE